MSRVNLVVVALVAIITPTAVFAAADTPATHDRPAEIVIIGAGEMMDALHRAVADEVAIINEDGGVMGQPLTVTRVKDACDANVPKDMIDNSKGVAARRPLLVFQSFCHDSGLLSAAAYAERNVLYMGVGDWPAELTEKRAGPTIFRLAPNRRLTRESAFLVATTVIGKIEILGVRNNETEDIINELQREFIASPDESERWGNLLESGSLTIGGLAKIKPHTAHGRVNWTYEPDKMAGAAVIVFPPPEDETGLLSIEGFAEQGWRGVAIVQRPNSKAIDEAHWQGVLQSLPAGIRVHVIGSQPFYLGPPPAGAKAYTAFHPDWVAGFWQVMKALKSAKSLDGREIAATLGGKTFFSRAPWLMLQSQSRYQPPELRQRFNANGDLRMPGYRLKKIWPKE